MKHNNKSNHFNNGKCWNGFNSDSGRWFWVIHFSFQRQKHPSAIQRHCRQAFARAAVLFYGAGSIKVDERRPVSRQESCWQEMLPFAIFHVALFLYYFLTFTWTLYILVSVRLNDNNKGLISNFILGNLFV